MVDDEDSIEIDFPRRIDNVRGASPLSSGNPPLQKYQGCSLCEWVEVVYKYAYAISNIIVYLSVCTT